MEKDKLFLLAPDFRSGDKGPFYCPACAAVEGLLSFYPALRETLEVHYLAFARPRAAIVAELGEAHQGLPALVLNPTADPATLAGLDLRETRGRRFLTAPADIGRYLARTRGIGEPH